MRWLLILLMIAAGFCIAIQGAVNSRLRLAVESPVLSSAISFLSGGFVLVCLMSTGAFGGKYPFNPATRRSCNDLFRHLGPDGRLLSGRYARMVRGQQAAVQFDTSRWYCPPGYWRRSCTKEVAGFRTSLPATVSAPSQSGNSCVISASLHCLKE
jgi:hypothetical protein